MLEALALIGVDVTAKGPVRPLIMVATSTIRSKHYRANLRKSDGQLLYRWGRLATAEATFIDGKFSTARFHREREW